jgi:hypothetical protein
MENRTDSTMVEPIPVLEALYAKLRDVLEGDVSPASELSVGLSQIRPDALLQVDPPNTISFRIAVQYLRHAYPRDVQSAIFRLEALTRQNAWEADIVPLIAADAFSPGATDLLQKAKISYFDMQLGALMLRAPGFFVKILPVQIPKGRRPTRSTMDLFTDARACVVHALLERHHQWLTVADVAQLAQSSTYTCSTVLQELEKRGWCEAEGSNHTFRRRLIMPNALLDAWASAWKSKKEQRTKWYTFIHGDRYFDALPGRIEKAGITFPWAFTGTAAANAYAPLLTGNHAPELIIPRGKVAEIVDALELKPVDKGGNVTLIERGPASLLFRREWTPDTWLASPFIMYLDLLNGLGRNKELAQNVRDKLELGTDAS